MIAYGHGTRFLAAVVWKYKVLYSSPIAERWFIMRVQFVLIAAGLIAAMSLTLPELKCFAAKNALFPMRKAVITLRQEYALVSPHPGGAR